MSDYLTLEELEVTVKVELPSKKKSIDVRPYRPLERLDVLGELKTYSKDGEDVDADKLTKDVRRDYIKLLEKIAIDVCYLDGELLFCEENEGSIRRLSFKDLETIANAAMSGGDTNDLDSRTKK